jgi:hypothetical protein
VAQQAKKEAYKDEENNKKKPADGISQAGQDHDAASGV